VRERTPGKGTRACESASNYRITVTPEGDGPPADVRLRRALKTLLRTHRLRCIEVRAVAQRTTPENSASVAQEAR